LIPSHRSPYYESHDAGYYYRQQEREWGRREHHLFLYLHLLVLYLLLPHHLRLLLRRSIRRWKEGVWTG
jgi:hypothetical protein